MPIAPGRYRLTATRGLEFALARQDVDVPGPGAERPDERFLADPRSGEGRADLGAWNWVDLDAEGTRREGESAAEALARHQGAFKTPVLRNLQKTGEYDCAEYQGRVAAQ